MLAGGIDRENTFSETQWSSYLELWGLERHVPSEFHPTVPTRISFLVNLTTVYFWSTGVKMEHVQEYAFPSIAAGSEPVRLYCPGIKISRKILTL